MAEPWEWEEQDLINLIVRQAEEGTELDFKRCAAIDLSDREKTKRDMSKDVSAFANAAGGALLYGMLEEDHVAHEIDAGYDPDEGTRERREQGIRTAGDVVKEGEVVDVRIKAIDIEQRRISLSLKIAAAPSADGTSPAAAAPSAPPKRKRKLKGGLDR